MKVYAHHDIVRQRVVVYIETAVEDGFRWYQGMDGTLHQVRPGDEPPMYAAIPDEVAEAVGEALAPRPDVTGRHLDDALEVRDRLLTLIETTVNRSVRSS